MHPRIAELFTYLDQEHAAFRATVDAFPQERIADAPADERWSAIQVIEHLVLTERRITKLAGMLIAQARTSGVRAEDDATPILPTINTARIADRSRRITAPEMVVPTATRPLAEALAALDAAHRVFKETVLQGDGLAFGEISYQHQSLGTLDLYQWVAFVGAHKARHAAQIRELRATLMAGGAAAAAS